MMVFHKDNINSLQLLTCDIQHLIDFIVAKGEYMIQINLIIINGFLEMLNILQNIITHTHFVETGIFNTVDLFVVLVI